MGWLTYTPLRGRDSGIAILCVMTGIWRMRSWELHINFIISGVRFQHSSILRRMLTNKILLLVFIRREAEVSANGKKVQGIAAMMLRHTQRMKPVCCPMINFTGMCTQCSSITWEWQREVCTSTKCNNISFRLCYILAYCSSSLTQGSLKKIVHISFGVYILLPFLET